MEWSVVYEKAIRDDGTLYFPERPTQEFLHQARRTMGSYLFSNQYQNVIVPDEEKKFRREWLRYSTEIPTKRYSFGFIDPAIGQSKHSDFTGIAIISVGLDGTWYLRHAHRYRLTPTQIVAKAFDICREFDLSALGIEQVAYQEALLYFLSEEMQKRDHFIPVKGITRTRISKESRILGLVPRFEWGKIYVAPGMYDFEEEYDSFPRGSHDDILDSLASLEELVFYPEIEQETKLEQPHSAHDADYERWVRQQCVERANSQNSEGGGVGGEFGF